jgi:hypothetical protein
MKNCPRITRIYTKLFLIFSFLIRVNSGNSWAKKKEET